MGTDVLMTQLQATLDELDGWLGSQSKPDPERARHARQNLEPVVTLAGEIAAGYRDFLTRYRPVLERMQALDSDALSLGMGAGALGDVAGDATRLLKETEESIAMLDGIGGRAGAWTEAKEGRTRLSDRLGKEVQSHVGYARQCVTRVEVLRERIDRFLKAQRAAA